MFTMAVRIDCDNDKCPHEATGEAMVAYTMPLMGTGMSLVRVFASTMEQPELPQGWQFRDNTGQIFCSASCEKESR